MSQTWGSFGCTQCIKVSSKSRINVFLSKSGNNKLNPEKGLLTSIEILVIEFDKGNFIWHEFEVVGKIESLHQLVKLLIEILVKEMVFLFLSDFLYVDLIEEECFYQPELLVFGALPILSCLSYLNNFLLILYFSIFLLSATMFCLRDELWEINDILLLIILVLLLFAVDF